MARRPRKKTTPTAVKRARGNPSRRPLPRDEPAPALVVIDGGAAASSATPPAGKRPAAKSRARKPALRRAAAQIIPPPEWLDGPALAKWAPTVQLLTDMRVLTVADLDAVACYCEAYGKVVEARAIVAVEGMIVRESRTISKDGKEITVEEGPKKHPAVNIEREWITVMRLIGAELGLTPSARARLTVPPNADADPLEKYLDGIS